MASSGGTIGSSDWAGHNHVIVTGPNSAWNNSGQLYVGGKIYFNTLLISDGGTVNNTDGIIGNSMSAYDNQVTVTGPNSAWNNNGQLTVGDYGAFNTLLITNGGTVNSIDGMIGRSFSGHDNQVTVAGPDSTWSNLGALTVGAAGSQNTLLITDGGQVSSSTGFIGERSSGGFGDGNQAIVSGLNSAWNISGALTVGGRATDSMLLITNGGTVNSTDGIIGRDGLSDNTHFIVSGHATVSGANSAWNNSGQLSVGYGSADNTLLVADGGTVSAAAGVVVGFDSTSTNNLVTVDGGMLRATNVGDTATLDIRRGTTVLNAGLIEADRLVMTNPPGQFTFNSGTVRTRGMTVDNGSAFVVGNGSGAANLYLEGNSGHYFGAGLTVRLNATAFLNGGVVRSPAGLSIQSGGRVQMGIDNVLEAGTPLYMLGGTFSLAGHTQGPDLGGLSQTESSFFDFGVPGTAQTLSFSDLLLHASGSLLHIANWEGTYLTGGGTDGLFIRTAAGVTPDFLANVQFDGYAPGALLLGTGELVPVVPVSPVPYTYTTNNGTITITGYTGPGGAVTIPDTITGLPVTSIGDYAFSQRTNLTSVTIPTSVITIGASAFKACTGLTNVTIPTSVTSIGMGAFSGCTSLTRVSIPNSVTSIDFGTFKDCTSLTNVTIPNSVTSIGIYAFSSCSSLINVTIGNSVTNIDGFAFRNCTSLASVTIPNSVTTIGDSTFLYCTGLTSVTIPNSVTSIGTWAFLQCISLTSVTIPNGVTTIGWRAFSHCTSLTSVTIPNSVTSIQEGVFSFCTSLTNITIDNGVTNIGDGMFKSCISLTSVTIPASVTSIGDEAFFYCSNLTGVYFQGNAPTLVGGTVFDGATNATVYYWAGTTGWGPTFGGRPTMLWYPQVVISTHPQSQTVLKGANVTFTVIATGAEPLSYLWRKEGIEMTGATNSTLTLSNVQTNQAGGYDVVITNFAGSVTSSVAVLTVGVAPFITTHPFDQTVSEGGTTLFSVVADGTGPLSYQWWFNNAPIPGAISASLFITDATPSLAGTYFVVVTNIYGSITSSNATLTVLPAPAKIRVIAASGVSAVNVVVPIHMTVSTNENALGFSLLYDPAVLSYDSAALGSGSAGGSLLPNTSQTSIGKLGLAVALPFGVSYAPGTQEVVKVTFLARPITAPTMTLVNFGDQPTPRELVNVQATVLPATYSGAGIQITPGTYEADVAPRPNGDHNVSIADWVQVGRFVAGLDQVTSPGEFLRADCAPRSNRGNGKLTVTDWVQAGRYAAGLDPITLVGGPTPGSSLLGRGPQTSGDSGDDALRVLRILSTNCWAGQIVTACLQMDSLGDETALGASLSFDTTALRFLSARLGAHAASSTLNVNTNEAAAGRLGLVLSLPFGSTLVSGTRELVLIDFQIAPTTSGATPLALNDAPVVREVSDPGANTLSTAYENGAVGVSGLPVLNATLLDQAIKLSWAAPAAPFVLQVSGTFAEWLDVVEPPATNGLTVSVTVPLSGTNQFFRLRKN